MNTVLTLPSVLSHCWLGGITNTLISPTNSPNPNLMDHKVWGLMQQRVYECRMNSVDELKLRLIDVWNSLQ